MASTSQSKLAVIGLWVLKVLVALAFLAAAFFKLSGQPMMVTEFNVVGLGQGFRYLVGLIELAGAVLLLVPKTAWIGAALLLLVCVGALAAQISRIHMDVIHVFVLGGLTAFLLWASRPRAAAI